MEYVCPRCNYTTVNKYDLKKHLQRKNLCKPVNGEVSLTEIKEKLLKPKKEKYKCDVCSRVFASKNGWKAHCEKCNQTTVLIKMVQQQKQQIEDLSKQIKQSTLKAKTINNNVQNNVQNNNIVINSPYPLRKFGQEFTDYITDDFFDDVFFDTGLTHQSFTALLKLLHFDPDFPENHNVRIKSSKRQLMEIFRGDHWDIVTFVNGIREMIMNGRNRFKEYYDKNKEDIHYGLTKEELENVLNILDNIEQQLSSIIKSSQNDIIAVMETHRNTPPVEWSMPQSDTPSTSNNALTAE